MEWERLILVISTGLVVYFSYLVYKDIKKEILEN